MSTKIYDGYRRRWHGIADFNAFMVDMRETVHLACVGEYSKKLHRVAALVHDCTLLGMKHGYPEKAGRRDTPLWVAYDVMDQAHKNVRTSQQRDSTFDCEFSGLVYFHGNYAYFIVQSELSEVMNVWRALPGMDFYGYWNNTDKPDDVTTRQWTSRKRAWDAVFGGGRALTFEMFGSSPPWLGELRGRESDMPSLDERAEALAKIVAVDEFNKKHQDNNALTDNDKVWRYMMSGGFTKDVQDHAQRLSTMLALHGAATLTQEVLA